MTEKQPAEAHSKAADPQATHPKEARAQASWVEPKASALLVLADGTVFEGCGLGATGRAAAATARRPHPDSMAFTSPLALPKSSLPA